MKPLNKHDQFALNNKLDFIKDQKHPEVQQEEIGNQYQDKFEQIEKLNQDPIIQEKKQTKNIKKQEIQLKQQKGLNSQKNQAPSKQNNWNQKHKIQTQIGLIQPQVQRKKQVSSHNLNNLLKKVQQVQKNQHIIFQNQIPTQPSMKLLKNQVQVHHGEYSNQQQVQHKDKQKSGKHQSTKKYQLPQKSHQQLLNEAYEQQIVIKELRKKVEVSRNQIKNIGSVVDKDIQKSIAKISGKNSRNVNLKQLFSDVSQSRIQGQNHKIKGLKQQLQTIRIESKKIKKQIASIQNKLSDPVTIQNSIKYQQIQTKFKLLSIQVGKKNEERNLVKMELARMKQGLNLEEKQMYDQSIQKNEKILNKTLSQIKEQRTELYKREKKDIQLMQKLKFFTQKGHKLTSTFPQKKSQKSLGQGKMSQHQIKMQIEQLVSSINDIFDQRNRTESQKSKLLRSLQNEAEALQAQNMKTLNQVRNIDSSLLQFYTHKVQKKNGSMSKVVPKTAQRLHQTIDSGSSLMRQKYEENNAEINDKNMICSSTSSKNFRSKVQAKKGQVRGKAQYSVETQEPKENRQHKNGQHKNGQSMRFQQKRIEQNQQKLIESKTVLSFGDLKVDQTGAILSDQILGRVKIKQITFLVDKKNCYGVYCKYFSQQNSQILGMKISEKNAEQKAEKISLILDVSSVPKQQFSTIKVGYSSRNQIKHIEIVTSLNKSLKWTVQNQVSKIESKNLSIYDSISIKAKLISSEQIPITTKNLNQLSISKPKIKIGGIGFSVIQQKNAKEINI